MIIGVVTNLITGEWQFRLHIYYCCKSYMGVIHSDLWVFHLYQISVLPPNTHNFHHFLQQSPILPIPPNLLWIFDCTMKSDTMLIKSTLGHEADAANSWQDLLIESTEGWGRWVEIYTGMIKDELTDSRSFFFFEMRGDMLVLLDLWPEMKVRFLIFQVFTPKSAWGFIGKYINEDLVKIPHLAVMQASATKTRNHKRLHPGIKVLIVRTWSH